MKLRYMLCLLLLTFLGNYAAGQDKQENVKLTDERRQKIEFGSFNIFVTKGETDENDVSTVTIEIENLDETQTIVIFKQAYPEKELKKYTPAIYLDKGIPGVKGWREIETFKEAKSDLFIEPSDTKQLVRLQIKGGEKRVCRIPLYIATYKNRKQSKLLLMQKVEKELLIEVQLKPDEDYVRLEKECQSIALEISNQSFCTNSRHRPSLKNQEAPFREKITKLKAEIDEMLSQWFSTSKRYKQYTVLKERLDSIDFSKYERDCGKHTVRSVATAKCKYCDLSPKQICEKLDYYYRKIYRSSNRKAEKAAVIADVNLLYDCKRHHSSAWKSSSYRERIEDYYTRICSF